MNDQYLDDLTGILKRDVLENKVHSAFLECIKKFELDGKKGVHYSIVMFDVDYFKAVNDLFGHKQGDIVLAGVGEILRDYQSRAEFIGVCGRYGGDEFLIVLPYNPSKKAKYIADEIRTIVENYEFLEVKKDKFSLKDYITLSMGVGSVEISKIYESISGNKKEIAVKNITDQVKHEANLALDYAKFLGKNRVEIFSEYLEGELKNLNTVRKFFFVNAYKSVSDLKIFKQEHFIKNEKLSSKIIEYFNLIKKEINERDIRTQSIFADNIYRFLISNYDEKFRKEILNLFEKEINE
jgi:diguanylate cyclase (GGDEF)-like protein